MLRQGCRLAAAALLLAVGLSLLLPLAHGRGAAAVAMTPASAEHQTSTGHRGAGPPAQIELPVQPAGTGAPIAMPPVGLSLEYSTMAQDLGTGPCPSPALIAELRALGSPPLALAGESQDLTVPPGPLSQTPPSWETATLYTLPASFWAQLHCLLSATGDPLDAGLNLRKGVPSWATLMVAGAQSAATNGLEFSLGNEPDLYSLHNYASLTKSLPNAEAVAVGLYLQLAGALQQAIPGLPVIGPELANARRWRVALPRVIAQLHETAVGVHLYPLSACSGPGAVTIPRLLSPAAANAPLALAWVVADANAARVPAILGEANSASCGGQAGVSDSPAAAVWAVRFVLSALKVGFREVRFHFSGGPYDPFVVRGAQVVGRPLESALQALNEWLPVGTSIQTLRGVSGLVATAVTGDPTTPQLILDNEGTKKQTVVLRGVETVHVQLLSATRAGIQFAQLSATHGRIVISVAANSVMAVGPGAT